MPTFYYVNVTIHVLAAMFWLGGMFFLGLVGAPALRSIEPAAVRQRVFHDIGSRFRQVAWWTIGVLVVTGIVNLRYRGWLHWDGVLGSRRFWGTTAGHALGVKLSMVLVMISISAVHDFLLGPRAGRLQSGSPEALASRRRAGQLARINAICGVILVAAAVRLVRAF